MATTNNVKVQFLLNLIHNQYEQATDTPSLTDDDGIIRMNLMTKGISRWETEDGIRWRELHTLNFAAPAISANTIVYDLSFDDYREIASRFRLLRTDGSYLWVSYVSPEYYTQNMDGNGRVRTSDDSLAATISGNTLDGYQLNLGWVPNTSDGTVGAIPYFDYYKWANTVTTVNDIVQMSNPFFLVDYVTAELFANDDPNLYAKFNGDALSKLANMRVQNEATPPFASSAIEDTNYSFAMG